MKYMLHWFVQLYHFNQQFSHLPSFLWDKVYYSYYCSRLPKNPWILSLNTFWINNKSINIQFRGGEEARIFLVIQIQMLFLTR